MDLQIEQESKYYPWSFCGKDVFCAAAAATTAMAEVLISGDNILTQWVPAAAVVTSPTYYVLGSESSRFPCTTLFIVQKM